MPSTTLSRDEMLAEYAVREALDTVSSRIAQILEDRDVAERLTLAGGIDALAEDVRLTELFAQLFPGDNDEPDDRTSAESNYIAARILRTIVYHADYLRDEARDLFVKASRERFTAHAAKKGADNA